jgi:putative RNA 2'-phosphotransferase
MTDKQKIKTSKFVSLVLRHNPSAAGVSMDPQGWVNVSSLLVGLRQAGYPTTLTELEEIVAEDNKQRYSFNKFKSHIRANQGHSIPVNLGLEPTVPPKELFHGTGVKYIDNIFKEGIKPQSRQYVHLSLDISTARTVGSRHGDPRILIVDAYRMYLDGYKFYLSENKVWLTDFVPKEYINVYYE